MTVVVGVDDSAASRAALRLAAQEASWRKAPLVAVSPEQPLPFPASLRANLRLGRRTSPTGRPSAC
jgi:nucleotide-binding universal stress UspA family protein